MVFKGRFVVAGHRTDIWSLCHHVWRGNVRKLHIVRVQSRADVCGSISGLGAKDISSTCMTDLGAR